MKRRPSSNTCASYGALRAPVPAWFARELLQVVIGLGAANEHRRKVLPRLLVIGGVAAARYRVVHPLYGRAAASLFRENHEVSLAAARRHGAAELAAEADGRLLQGPAVEPPKTLPKRTASRQLQIAPAGFTVSRGKPARRSRCGAPEYGRSLAPVR